MNGKSLFLPPILAIFFVFSAVNAFAISTGGGSLDVSFGIVFDSNTIGAFFDHSRIESWNTSRIASWGTDENGDYGSYILANEGPAIYDNDRTPGWDIVPDNQNISYGTSTVQSNFDHTDIFKPKTNSTVNLTASNDPYPDGDIYAFANNTYYSEFKASGEGSFTVYLDYEGSWQGSTTAVGDKMYVFQSAELRVTDVFLDERGFLQYGDQLFGSYVYDRITLENIDSGVVDDFSGRLEFTVPYVTGDMFSLLFSAKNHAQGYSIQPINQPVPEPSTILLLGSGLAGLSFYARKRKKHKKFPTLL